MRPQSWKKSETQGPWFWFCFSNVDSILCRYLLETPLIFWPRNKESLLQSNLREIGKGKINVSKNLWFFHALKKEKWQKFRSYCPRVRICPQLTKDRKHWGEIRKVRKGRQEREWKPSQQKAAAEDDGSSSPHGNTWKMPLRYSTWKLRELGYVYTSPILMDWELS